MLTGRITTSESGGDLVVMWKIHPFFTLPEWDGDFYYSHDFFFDGEKWYLGIYPNGLYRHDSSGHVDFTLFKHSSDCYIKQSFSLSLETAKGEKYNEQHFSKDFDNDNRVHKFNRFIPRLELSMRWPELVPDDVLTVVCTMKNTRSVASASNTASTSAQCCHRKGTFNDDSLSSHQKKSMHQPTKCPVVVLEKWLNEHDCLQERPEVAKVHEESSETTGVNASTQTEERDTGKEHKEISETTGVNVETQTEEKDRGKEHKENSETAGVNAETQTEEKDSEACASGSSISSHEKKLHDDLKDLFLKKEDCDVIIKVKGLEIPAHRVILKARSPVFASTFKHNMKENATGIVEIEVCDPSPFIDFLCFLYCGDIGMISQENVFSLFRLADKYEVLDFKAKCLEFLKKNITVDTFCETITLALQYSEIELIALATDFFVRNAEEILQTVKWQTFVAENLTQSNELMIKLVKWFKHSNV